MLGQYARFERGLQILQDKPPKPKLDQGCKQNAHHFTQEMACPEHEVHVLAS